MLGAEHRVRKGGMNMNPGWSMNRDRFRVLSMCRNRGFRQ